MGAHLSSTTQQPVSSGLLTLLLEACHSHSLRMEEGWQIKWLPLTCLLKLARNVNVQINVKSAEMKKSRTTWTNYCNKLIYDAVVRVTLMCDCVFIPPGPSVKSMFMCSFRKKTNCIQYAQTVPLTELNPIQISMDNTQHLQDVILHLLKEKKLYQI